MSGKKPDQSYIQHHGSGGATVSGPDAMRLMKAITLRSSLKLYAKTKIIPTRGVTLMVMLKLANEFTGKTYKRTQLELAVADLDTWIAAMKAGMPVLDEKGNPT